MEMKTRLQMTYDYETVSHPLSRKTRGNTFAVFPRQMRLLFVDRHKLIKKRGTLDLPYHNLHNYKLHAVEYDHTQSLYLT